MSKSVKSLYLKILGAAAIGVASVLVFMGSVPPVEVNELPTYTIIQKQPPALSPFNDWSFSYLDSAGERQPISCPPVAFFERSRHCESDDGLVSFTFWIGRQSITLNTITVDGVDRPMTRVRTELENARRIWVPTDSLPTAP